MRERLSIQKPIGFTESMAEKIETVADHPDVSFSEIVRACVEYDLPRLRERERKRVKKRKQPRKVIL